jgi:hypothetical protein
MTLMRRVVLGLVVAGRDPWVSAGHGTVVGAERVAHNSAHAHDGRRVTGTSVSAAVNGP